ncbi:D-glycero-beta-D-manno-heptose 1-phosphate adenylyltransferase [Gynurincola endophyticus]|jgi:rfaE bifunctional protein nucleotidyltransferase chain/domain|uniref:D-glycero-beta-D-manno-heptose 1-phosphate adenylyltransferase n=1 Tax=Gynurincola endophyticus TaxID=2479004 RepID=UPI000F8D7DB2|nr:D-glycero-beta-D-manno-heptose 1-phosphate adenylyltransferase [Gynurincola endophyticus]
MKQVNKIPEKIYAIHKLQQQIAIWKFLGKKIAFTNGCFDILHKGHIFSLSEAAATADILIVGLNADKSVKRLKGESRPVNDEDARALLLASLSMVDAVILFEEDTPQQLIAALLPDVLVKGGDYTVEQIAGAQEVIANGGKVVINPIIEGFSTTGIIEKMKQTQ